MEKEKIIILMPIFNGVEFFEESLESVFNQTYKNWELWIGVNGFEENSATYNKVLNVLSEKDKTFCWDISTSTSTGTTTKCKVFDFYDIKGKSKTLNKMVGLIKTGISGTVNYISLLDVDDLWSPEKLRLQSVYFDKSDIIGSSCIYFGDELYQGIIPKLPSGYINNFDFFLFNPIINSSVVMKINIAVWDEGKWSEIEDYHLWLSLWKTNKYLFYNIPNICVKHRIHSDSAFNAKGNHTQIIPRLYEYIKTL